MGFALFLTIMRWYKLTIKPEKNFKYYCKCSNNFAADCSIRWKHCTILHAIILKLQNMYIYLNRSSAVKSINIIDFSPFLFSYIYFKQKHKNWVYFNFRTKEMLCFPSFQLLNYYLSITHANIFNSLSYKTMSRRLKFLI